MSERIGCVVLAAGASRRLGHPKQLLLHRGRPLVLSAAECACDSRADSCAVVIGSGGGAVRAALAECPVEILENLDWNEGIAASIRVAVAWAQARECHALMLVLCDQPRLDAAHLDRLISEYERQRLPVASHYAGKNAVPALFPRAYFGALAKLSGDSGASQLLNGATPVTRVPWRDGEWDVDTPETERQFLTSEP